MPGLTATEVAAWVEASCKRQGLALKVTNSGALGRVAALLVPQAGGGGPAALRQPESKDSPRKALRESA